MAKKKSGRELNERHEGDKRYQRRSEDGTFSKSDDVSKSLSRDVKQHSGTKKPKSSGDKGDGKPDDPPASQKG